MKQCWAYFNKGVFWGCDFLNKKCDFKLNCKT